MGELVLRIECKLKFEIEFEFDSEFDSEFRFQFEFDFEFEFQFEFQFQYRELECQASLSFRCAACSLHFRCAASHFFFSSRVRRMWEMLIFGLRNTDFGFFLDLREGHFWSPEPKFLQVRNSRISN